MNDDDFDYTDLIHKLDNKDIASDYKWRWEQQTSTAISKSEQRFQKLERELSQVNHERSQLKQELMEMKLDETSEQLLREQHPGLKEAWEQYQSILALVKDY